MGKKDLKSFIAAQKKKNHAADTQYDWGKRKLEWLSDIERLYKDIETWLNSYLEKNDATIDYEVVKLNERNIGIYETRKMIITLAGEQVELKPAGTMIIGSKGRVDLRGSNGVVKLVRVPKESKGPVIKVSVSAGEPPQSAQDTGHQNAELTWKIATPPPAIRYIELDSDTLADALMEVIQG